MAIPNLGILHTIIGIIAIAAAVVSYIKYCKINLAKLIRKNIFLLYNYTSVTSISSRHK